MRRGNKITPCGAPNPFCGMPGTRFRPGWAVIWLLLLLKPLPPGNRLGFTGRRGCWPGRKGTCPGKRGACLGNCRGGRGICCPGNCLQNCWPGICCGPRGTTCWLQFTWLACAHRCNWALKSCPAGQTRTVGRLFAHCRKRLHHCGLFCWNGVTSRKFPFGFWQTKFCCCTCPVTDTANRTTTEIRG